MHAADKVGRINGMKDLLYIFYIFVYVYMIYISGKEYLGMTKDRQIF